MKKLILLFLLTQQFVFAISPPFICFSDLTSGPSYGNSDSSQPGQIAGQDGAIVTIWGKNLGSSEGNSQVIVGGQVARIYSWGNAITPAELFQNLGMQKVEFQIPSSVPVGVVDIKIVMGSVESNLISFTIRPGNIYFIKTSGNDITGDGSWNNPWASLDNISYTGALDKINPGDIIYICDGVKHEALAGDRATIDLGNPGTESAPKAIVGYPGANAFIGNDDIQKAYSLWVSGFGPTINWVISKMNLTANSDAASMYHNFRLVGNKITAPKGDGPTGAVAGQGNHLYLLGNELTNIGFAGTSKLYHPVYFQSAEACSGPRLPTETDREIAWNNMHDNLAFDGINIYRECGSSAFMNNHRVHDNFILNQTGCGIRIGDYVTGENWFYNNLIINAGLGPDPATEEAMHVPVLIHAGWEGINTLIHFYNNTIYGGSYTGGANWASGMVGFINSHPMDLDFRNNIIVSTLPGVGYSNFYLSIPTSGVANNLWFGAGVPPIWDNNSLNVNPLFVNVPGNNFRLNANSPAINPAFPTAKLNALPLPIYDFDALLRLPNGPVDLGAFEFQTPIVLAVNEIKLEAFSLSSTETKIVWQSENVDNISEFVVQYSSDGFDFKDFCSVNIMNKYECVFQSTNSQTTYFRIAMLHQNGQKTFSKIIENSRNNKLNNFRVNIYPNPTINDIEIELENISEKKVSLTLFNTTGKKVQCQISIADNTNKISFPINNIQIGLYYLEIKVGNERQLFKILKI